MKKIAFLSLGCKTNQYEIEAMKEKLQDVGYVISDFSNEANWYVINTCTVTNESAKKSRQMIRRAIRNGGKVAVMGCYSQVEKDFFEDINGIDIICGTKNRNKIIKYIIEDKEADLREEASKNIEYEDMEIDKFMEHTRAYIKIEDGCNNFCSYCIIPYARGSNVRCRNPINIIEEAKRLGDNGYKEIVLTGTNICKYNYNDYKLIDLLEKLNEVKEIERVRLGSVYPDYLNKNFIDRYSKLEKMCHHFHISIQSGSDEILKLMNRRYNRKEIINNLKYITNSYSDYLFTCDIITGFPKETQKDFNDTYTLIESFEFYHVHVFIFSPREGTKAANMKGFIDGRISKQRRDRLIELSLKKKNDIIKKFKGKSAKVVFERKTENGYLGHSRNYIECISKEKVLLGKEIEVKITGYINGMALVEKK